MNAPVSLDTNTLEYVRADSTKEISTWFAHLNLEFALRKRGVRLVKSEHQGPLYVQKAFYPEGPNCAHVYILHPPGGLVTGDTLSIDITAQTSTHVVLTTPGAGRIYKAREQGGTQTQNITLKLAQDSVIEWFPLETILFPGSHARMNTRVELESGASFMGWDVTCFGLPANDIALDACIENPASLKQSMQIWRAGRILLNERLVIDNNKSDVLNGSAGLRSFPVHGLMLAGPFADNQDTLIAALKEIQEQTKQLLAVSLVGEFLTIRYLGICTEEARKLFIFAWRLIRPELINKAPIEPRIWAT